VPALTAALKDGHGSVREAAAEALGTIGLTDKEVEAWIAALQDNDPEMRRLAILRLKQLGTFSPYTKRLLIGGLKSPEKMIRIVCAQGLGRIGADASDAVPVLVDAVKDEKGDHDARIAFTEALVKIEPKAAAQHIIELLKSVPTAQLLKG